jgi:hypothetical protein
MSESNVTAAPALFTPEQEAIVAKLVAAALADAGAGHAPIIPVKAGELVDTAKVLLAHDKLVGAMLAPVAASMASGDTADEVKVVLGKTLKSCRLVLRHIEGLFEAEAGLRYTTAESGQVQVGSFRKALAGSDKAVIKAAKSAVK